MTEIKEKNIFSSYRNYKLKILHLWLWLCIFLPQVQAQDSNVKIYEGVMLDEVLVQAVQTGSFSVTEFINRVKKDTTFYKAFKSLRLLSFNMLNDIEIYDKNENVKASCHSITQQVVNNRCRTMVTKQEKIKGDYFNRKKEYNYYTAKLYAHLFFTQGKICNENNIVGNTKQQGSTKYEEQLRMLIFNPGQRIYGIPGIGENVAIYEEPYFSKYDFKLKKEVYNDDTCYVFKALPKPAFKNEVVINELKTWIRIQDFAIVAREYALSYRTWIYDFDVVMKVKLRKFGNYLVPYSIQYRGNWHALTKGREIASFTSTFSDFK